MPVFLELLKLTDFGAHAHYFASVRVKFGMRELAYDAFWHSCEKLQI